MAKLILGGNEFPLVMTVGVLDDMAMRGYPVDKIPEFFRKEGQPIETDMDHGIEFILMTARAGQAVAVARDGADPKSLPELPAPELLRPLLTPGDVWGLCDDAIRHSLVRTVEAEPGKKTAAVTESP